MSEIKLAKEKMAKTVESFKHTLAGVRAGRAHPSLLQHIQVEYYGSNTALNQLANVTVEDSRTLKVTPWDKTQLKAISKSIFESDLGINPVEKSDSIYLPLPALNQERRMELIKLVKNEGEDYKVTIRNIRRDTNAYFKNELKEKNITEDEARKSDESVQKLTDEFIAQIDALLKEKQEELLEI